MKSVLKSISWLALGLTIVPSILVLTGKMDIGTNKNLMAIGMVIWFATAPFWINQKRGQADGAKSL